MIVLSLGRLGLLLFVLAAAAAHFYAVSPASARIVGGDPSVVSPADLSPAGPSAKASPTRGASTATLAIARRYIGGNPTGRRSQWCADFMNLVEKKAGRGGSGSRLARSYLGYGTRVSKPQPGDIVVLSRRGGGHVGYFVGWEDGQIVLLSGNHGNRVGIGNYPTSRVLGYRRP